MAKKAKKAKKSVGVRGRKKTQSSSARLVEIVETAASLIAEREREILDIRGKARQAAAKLAEMLNRFAGTSNDQPSERRSSGKKAGRLASKAAASSGKRYRSSGEEVQERLRGVLKALEGTSKDKPKSRAEILEATGLDEKHWIPTMGKIQKAKLVKSVGSRRDMRYFLSGKLHKEPASA